jgi:hypothetical protein
MFVIVCPPIEALTTVLVTPLEAEANVTELPFTNVLPLLLVIAEKSVANNSPVEYAPEVTRSIQVVATLPPLQETVPVPAVIVVIL